jgi:hypothetical protein
MKSSQVARLLAYQTGLVNQESSCICQVVHAAYGGTATNEEGPRQVRLNKGARLQAKAGEHWRPEPVIKFGLDTAGNSDWLPPSACSGLADYRRVEPKSTPTPVR